jgi:anti-sigma factor RsiW
MVYGAATWQQQPYMSSSGGDPAALDTFTFGTPAAARSALAAASSGMKSCQATSRALQARYHITPDAVSHQTASATDAAAFERSWTGVAGVSAYGAQINHLYLATRGTTLVALSFDVYGKQPASYDVRNDPAVLTTLIADLDRLPR